MSNQDSIEQKIQQHLTTAFKPSVLDVVNESHMHNVPENSETHFKVVLVTSAFQGMGKVKRHQAIYGELQDQLNGGVHALALHTYTPEEWETIERPPLSPKCMGGSKG